MEKSVDKKKLEIQQNVSRIVADWLNEEGGNRVTRNNAMALQIKLDQYFKQLELSDGHKS